MRITNLIYIFAGVGLGVIGTLMYEKRASAQKPSYGSIHEDIRSCIDILDDKLAEMEKKRDNDGCRGEEKKETTDTEADRAAAARHKPDLTDYVSLYRQKTEAEEKQSGIYIISPDEFGETDYETIGLVYYADGVLADDFDDVIEDVADKVGTDFAAHFGDYEEYVVHVRNTVLERDYEICKDNRTYRQYLKDLYGKEAPDEDENEEDDMYDEEEDGGDEA